MNTIINIENLSKSYGKQPALRDVSLQVGNGELFGLIGPDGAGKTTLFRILTTLLLPDSGSAMVLGLDTVREYRALRRRFGYMPGRFSLYQDLSVEENLEFFATIFGTTVEENYDLIRDIYVQIEPFKKRRAGALSGGMKQKLALSCALIHKPDILFLDEPTTGVDAVSRREFWDMLRRLKEGGLTIIVSTPYMDEALRCDRVALMQEGRFLAIDTPEGIGRMFGRPLLAVRAREKYKLLQHLRSLESSVSAHTFGEYIHYTDRRDSRTPEQLDTQLIDEGFTDVDVKRIDPGVEDTFMSLMQQKEEAK
ncbi:MAG: ABC transporter ATP-binding protein [Cyclonatronaceae bacterium]